MNQWAGASAATSETPTASLLDALLDPSCRACPSFMSPNSSLLGAAVLLILSKRVVYPPVAVLVALLDGAVKAVAYLPGQPCVIGDLLLALWCLWHPLGDEKHASCLRPNSSLGVFPSNRTR